MEDAIAQSSNGSSNNFLDLMEYEIEINPCAKVSCNKQQGIRIKQMNIESRLNIW